MKKIIALFLCAGMALTIAACTKNDRSVANTSSVNTSSAAVSSSSETSSKEASKASSTATMTLDEFINQSKSAIDSLKSTFASQGLIINVLARSNSLVYQYQFTTAVADKSTAKSSLESAITAQDSVFKNTLATLKTSVPDAQSVIVEYLDADGSTLFSKEYK